PDLRGGRFHSRVSEEPVTRAVLYKERAVRRRKTRDVRVVEVLVNPECVEQRAVDRVRDFKRTNQGRHPSRDHGSSYAWLHSSEIRRAIAAAREAKASDALGVHLGQ